MNALPARADTPSQADPLRPPRDASDMRFQNCADGKIVGQHPSNDGVRHRLEHEAGVVD
jgi:hypothetical protein